MVKTHCILLFIFSMKMYAFDQTHRIESIYKKNDKRFELDCYYFSPNKFRLISPVDITNRSFGVISRDFVVNSNGDVFKFTFSVKKSDKNEGEYNFKFNNDLKISGNISKRSPMVFQNGKNAFFIPTKKIKRIYQSFVNEHEVYKISCRVNFAHDEKVPVTNENNNIHLNVHPHKKYDNWNQTSSHVESHFENKRLKNYVLLEEGNFKGNLVDLSDFLEMKDYQLVKNYYPESVQIPEHVELKVSPAGHNRYLFLATNDVNILYTGGYHNYCMWNNIRRLMTAYLRSQGQAQLNIVFDTDAIVVNPRGLVGLNLSFANVYKTKLLKDILNSDEQQAISYINKYFTYFTDIFLNNFKGLFKEVIFTNNSKYERLTKTVKGSGKRKLRVNFIYKNLDS